jgi:IPT/TIG domain/FG-GAP repeat
MENAMTDRIAVLARAALPWRLVVIAALLSLAPGLLLAHDLAGQRASSSSPTGALAVNAPPKLVSDLPLTAQGTVSAALGAADPSYRVSSAPGGGLQAFNPAQRLRAQFQATAVRLSSGATRFALSLRGVGRGGALETVAAARPQSQGNGVVYERAGLGEWYANGPLGIEQGFTVSRSRSGAGTGPLTLSLALSGAARAVLDAHDAGILLSGPGGPSLRYGDLLATDARGRVLHSWLELSGRQILLRVDTAGARYPLRIDPLIQEAKIPRPEGATQGLFGYSVALSADGDTAIVGAPKAAGGVWAFVREGITWSGQELSSGETTTATANECSEEGEECDGLGRSVAVSGDGQTALVGAPRANAGAGEAVIFNRTGSSWSSEELAPHGGSAGGRFGKSVALSADGRTALVGASAAHDSAGAAWVFTRQEGGTWNTGEELTGGSESSEGHFGLSVALSEDGDTALIGAPTVSGVTWNAGKEASSANAGAAWVFTRAESAPHFAQPGLKLTVHGEHEDEHEIGEGRFGYSVALSGDGNTALVGARTDREGEGAAWVLTRSNGWWTQGSKLIAGGEGGPVQFGYSVALSTDGASALIGSPKAGGGGAAWLFTGAGSSWSKPTELVVGEEVGAGLFGTSVALSGNAERALVGAPSDSGVGAVWPFGPPSGPKAVVESVSPQQGPTKGGTQVTIKGVNFDEVHAVKFGTEAAKSFRVNSEGTSITTTTPPSNEEGEVAVTVSTGSGESSLPNAFTYQGPGKTSELSPVVEGIDPTEGSAAGGTEVIIKGKHFGEGKPQVSFGSVAATSVARSGASIIAVSPAEPPESVDVTVTTSSGTSARSSSDKFTFVAKPPTNQSGGESSTSATSTSTTTAAGQVLAFGPAVSATCVVSLTARGVAVTARNRATVRLSSTGLAFSGACTGRLAIEVKVKLKGKKGHKSRFGAQTIGTASFAVASGRSAGVTVKLNAAGRALLAAHRGRLSAKLVILQVFPGPTTTHSAIVHLALAKAKPKPRPKK